MGYIYIFINSEHAGKNEELVKIGYATDWKKRLRQANNEPNNTATIYPYAVYETDEALSDKQVHHIIDTLNPDLRYKKQDHSKTEYFQLSPEKAFDIFKAIAEFTGTLTKLFKIDDSENLVCYKGKKDVTNGNGSSADAQKPDAPVKDDQELGKDELVDLLHRNGFILKGKKITKAHVIRSDHYWANPVTTVLDDDWTFLLHDQNKKVVYLLEIPANTFSLATLKTRNKPYDNKLDLRIAYSDPDFTDRASKVKFAPYIVGTLQYSNDEEQDVHINKQDIRHDSDGNTIAPLSQIPDNIKDCSIASFDFCNTHYEAEAWKDALDVTMEYLNGKYPLQIYKMASQNWVFSSRAEKPFVTLNKSIYSSEDRAHEIVNTGIYYKTNFAVKTIVKIMKIMFELFNENPNQLVITYNQQ